MPKTASGGGKKMGSAPKPASGGGKKKGSTRAKSAAKRKSAVVWLAFLYLQL